MLIYNHFRNRVAQNGYFNDSPLPNGGHQLSSLFITTEPIFFSIYS